MRPLNKSEICFLSLMLLTAFLIRFYALSHFDPNHSRYDQDYYRLEGLSIAEGRGFVTTYINRPMWNFLAPAFPAFLAFTYHLAPSDSGLDHRLNLIWDLFLLTGLYLFGRHLFGPTTGGIAALIGIFSFEYVQWSRYLVTDSLFAALLIWGAFFFYLSVEQKDYWLAATSGLVLGLAGLTKSNALTILPFLLLWGLFFLRDSMKRRLLFVSCFLAGVLIIVGPWMIRNHSVMNDPSPLQTISGVNLWMGNHPENQAPSLDTTDPQLMRLAYWGHSLREGEWNRQMQQKALGFILADPAVFLKKTLLRTGTTLSLGSPAMLLIRIRNLPLLYFPPILILSLFGLAFMILRGRYREILFFIPFLIGGLAPGILMMGIARHRMPFDWIFILTAAFCLSRLFDRRTAKEPPAEPWKKRTGPVLFSALLALLVMGGLILMRPVSPPSRTFFFEKEEKAMEFSTMLDALHKNRGEINTLIGESVSLTGRLTTPMTRSDNTVSYYFINYDEQDPAGPGHGAANLVIPGSPLPEGSWISGTGRVTGLSRAATVELRIVEDKRKERPNR